jgi:hypothetical protein
MLLIPEALRPALFLLSTRFRSLQFSDGRIHSTIPSELSPMFDLGTNGE